MATKKDGGTETLIREEQKTEEPPMYKVRVGDFLSRSGADAMKTRVRSEEYQDAFVVEALVVRPG